MGQLLSAPYVVSDNSSIGPEGFTVKRLIGMADEVALPSAQRTAPTSTVLLNEGLPGATELSSSRAGALQEGQS